MKNWEVQGLTRPASQGWRKDQVGWRLHGDQSREVTPRMGTISTVSQVGAQSTGKRLEGAVRVYEVFKTQVGTSFPFLLF